MRITFARVGTVVYFLHHTPIGRLVGRIAVEAVAGMDGRHLTDGNLMQKEGFAPESWKTTSSSSPGGRRRGRSAAARTQGTAPHGATELRAPRRGRTVDFYQGRASVYQGSTDSDEEPAGSAKSRAEKELDGGSTLSALDDGVRTSCPLDPSESVLTTQL